ncbi:unnamed protein product [Leptidea sinapis]|uniref:Uncharacterized protein n=1 Tax=Leptidea sinapis TaxID=189913 RepID=A0A5E4QUV5_9NEOP|nr:unnamed protein product [Leptidea sinapis]
MRLTTSSRMKEELLRNVFRKARRQAKDELARQLNEFQGKRRLGLATLYGPDDVTLQRCIVDNTQEVVVVERIMCQRLSTVARGGAGAAAGGGATSPDTHSALLAALVAAALCPLLSLRLWAVPVPRSFNATNCTNNVSSSSQNKTRNRSWCADIICNCRR